jgi:hypothetical protein
VASRRPFFYFLPLPIMYTFLTDEQIQAVSSRLLGRELTEEELDTVYSSIDNAIDFIDLAECGIDSL